MSNPSTKFKSKMNTEGLSAKSNVANNPIQGKLENRNQEEPSSLKLTLVQEG